MWHLQIVHKVEEEFVPEADEIQGTGGGTIMEG